MAENEYQPPTITAGDVAHSLVKGAISLAPLGGVAAEVFNLLIGAPSTRRMYEWCERVGESLHRLEQEGRCSIDDLQKNDVFLDTVSLATQAALRTSQAEKREALQNAVLNAALPDPPDATRQALYVRWVDELTTWHLRILELFADPGAWYERNGRQPAQFAISSSLGRLLTYAFPELEKERCLSDKLAKDLYDEGLLAINGLHAMMTAQGARERRATELGQGLLRFIADPIEH